MRKLLTVLGFVLFAASAQGGVYEEILDATERGDAPRVIDLLGRGMDVNTSDPAGNSLLMIASRTNGIELVRFLVTNRAGINRRNRFGDTAILLATIQGHVEVARLLKDAGAALDPGGWNVLHYACFGESEAMFDWAVSQGLDINAKAPNGMTPLMLTARQGKVAMVRTLLAKGADARLLDPDGRTAAELAGKAGFGEVFGILDNQSAGRN